MIDLIGRRFGKLIVLDKYDVSKNGSINWSCKCDCGNEIRIRGDSLKTGHTKNCGCLKLKHGHNKKGNKSRTYQSWQDMKKRCLNPNNQYYYNYGKRKITICDRWLNKKNGFINFLEDMGECPDGYQLDRINNNLGYYKENCRWTTSKINNRNRRNNHLLKYDGQELCFAEWEEITGIPQETIKTRTRRGWSIKRALTTPSRKRRKIK